jgi:hypothetical protein
LDRLGVYDPKRGFAHADDRERVNIATEKKRIADQIADDLKFQARVKAAIEMGLERP